MSGNCLNRWHITKKTDVKTINTDETDKIFVTLVRLIHTFAQAKKIHLTAEEIANAVLKRMVDYYEKCGYPLKDYRT